MPRNCASSSAPTGRRQAEATARTDVPGRSRHTQIPRGRRRASAPRYPAIAHTARPHAGSRQPPGPAAPSKLKIAETPYFACCERVHWQTMTGRSFAMYTRKFTCRKGLQNVYLSQVDPLLRPQFGEAALLAAVGYGCLHYMPTFSIGSRYG
jgi:hypothetical protein